MKDSRGLSNPKVHTIRDGVYAITGLYHVSGGMGTNAGIISSPEAIAFIDSGMTIASAQFIWNVAQSKIGGDRPLYLILTHHHSDHVFGMRVMKEQGSKVIAHSATCKFLENDNGKYKQFIRNLMNWSSEEADRILGDVWLSVPDLLIDVDTTLHIGTEIQLLVTPGHVPSSISVYHPSSRTLFAGDTVYEGLPLTTRFGGPEEWQVWISQLERLKNLDIELICPGHGNLCRKKELDRNIEFLADLMVKMEQG
ncbi:MAG: MBL fold metallo-hydrolase [Candidatus Thorarchaeota archaeon]|nr:MBL fold metallo-hydrolase [Candidatus Thorarchaeota archaeon]